MIALISHSGSSFPCLTLLLRKRAAHRITSDKLTLLTAQGPVQAARLVSEAVLGSILGGASDCPGGLAVQTIRGYHFESGGRYRSRKMVITLDPELEAALNQLACRAGRCRRSARRQRGMERFLAPASLEPRDEWERGSLCGPHATSVAYPFPMPP